MTCRHCRYLRVGSDKDGKSRIRKDNVYLCTVEIPLPPLPASVTTHVSFKWPPQKSWMGPEDGAGCALFKEKP